MAPICRAKKSEKRVDRTRLWRVQAAAEATVHVLIPQIMAAPPR